MGGRRNTLGKAWVGDEVIRLPWEVVNVAALHRRAFSWENPNSGTRVSAGDDGLEEIREVKEGMIELGDEVVGGRTGMGWRETSVISSHGSEVTISWYLSHS